MNKVLRLFLAVSFVLIGIFLIPALNTFSSVAFGPFVSVLGLILLFSYVLALFLPRFFTWLKFIFRYYTFRGTA